MNTETAVVEVVAKTEGERPKKDEKKAQHRPKLDEVEELAKILKEKVQSHNKLTLEVVKDLYKANSFYSHRGVRTDLIKGKGGNASKKKFHSWDDFLQYIGLGRSTAYNWLKSYLPEENRLKTLEERKAEASEKKKKSSTETPKGETPEGISYTDEDMLITEKTLINNIDRYLNFLSVIKQIEAIGRLTYHLNLRLNKLTQEKVEPQTEEVNNEPLKKAA
jgi:hypothetical protein